MPEAARAPEAPADAVGDDPIRDALVAAAASVFAEKGYDRAGVAEIAKRAGYTTGAIYGRFTGKAELLQAAIEDRTTDELDDLFASHADDGRATDVLKVVGAHLVTPSPDDEDEGALLLEAFVAARRDPEVRNLLQQSLDLRSDRLADLVAEAQATGAIDPALDAEAVVRFCHAVGFGFLLFRAAEIDLPAAEPWEALIARLVDALDANPPTHAANQGEPR
jgi:AcrR family transcriptional regulator